MKLITNGLNSVDIEIGGQRRAFKYTFEALGKLERVLPNQNLMATIADGVIPIGAIHYAVIFGLEGAGDRKLKVGEVEQWVSEYISENGVFELQQIILAAIMSSGILGTKKSKFEELEDVDTEVVDTKNA